MNLEDILYLQETRTVNKDNTVSYQNKRLQIPANNHRFSYAKTKVRIQEYSTGAMAIFHGPRCLGYFEADGMLLADVIHHQAVV